MPKGSRRLTPKQRAQRRRRREMEPLHPISAPSQARPAPSSALSSPQTTSEAAVMPPQAAVSPRASRPAAPAGVRAMVRQDPFLAKELQRIGVMSVSILAILIVLTVFLR